MRITRPSPETIAAWMEAPTPPAEVLRAADRQAATLHRAENTAAALALLADHYTRPLAELRRTLSRFDLEHETAKAIIHYARLRAAQLLQAREKPPAGDDTFQRTTRVFYARLQADREAREEAEADALLDRQRDDAPARRRPTDR